MTTPAQQSSAAARAFTLNPWPIVVVACVGILTWGSSIATLTLR